MWWKRNKAHKEKLCEFREYCVYPTHHRAKCLILYKTQTPLNNMWLKFGKILL